MTPTLTVTPHVYPHRVSRGWKPWRALREQADVDLALVELPRGVRGVLARAPDATVILIDRNLPPAERLAELAHELVHLERGGGCHRPGAPPAWAAVVAREEHRVDRIVAERLVPADELADLVARRVDVEPVTATVVADEFNVTFDVAQRALWLLQQQGQVGTADGEVA